MAGGVHGGAETFFEDLALSFAQAGVNQHIVTRPAPERIAKLGGAGLPITTLPFGSAIDLYTPLRLRSIAAQFRPDVVLGWMNRACMALPRGAHVNVGRLGGYYSLKYYRKCDALVCNTRDIRDYVVREGWPAAKAFYIPNFCPAGIEPALSRTSFDTPAGARILLILARLEVVKGIDVAIRALKAVPGAVLWIAGEGALRTSLEALAHDERVEARVKFLGWRNDRAALLRAADAVLVPSRHEPFGNVVVNAWVHGAPVIASASEGPGALIAHGEDGLLTALDDHQGLGAAIDRVLNEKDLAATLIAGGARKVSAEYSESAVRTQYLDVFRALLTQKQAVQGP
ncbi:MAG: glycosyltransferase [Rhodospirillaceae bacterium]|nr:glycosyltransferase [Rhodospirillaceae bacterium]